MAEDKFGHCIICHQDNVLLSDEHVIPKSLGGYYHINSVCKECNSQVLGAKVDPLLVDHPMMQLIRWNKKLKGQSSHYPKPLAKPDSDVDGNNYYVTEDAEGHLVPHVQTNTQCNYDSNGILQSFRITLDITNAGDAQKIADKILKKNGIDKSKYKIVETQTHCVEHPTMKYTWEMPLKDFNLDLLKIAYEFTCDCVPEYEKTAKGMLYSEILHNANPERLDEVVMSNYKMNTIVEKVFGDYIDFSTDDRHYLFLINTNGRLLCIVHLFNALTTGFVMDDKCHGRFEDSRVLINDIKQRKCNNYRLCQLLQMISSNRTITFQYDRKQYKGNLNLKKIPTDNISCVHQMRDNTLFFDNQQVPVDTVEYLIQRLPESMKRDSVIPGKHITQYFVPKGRYILRTDREEYFPIKEVIMTSDITKI